MRGLEHYISMDDSVAPHNCGSSTAKRVFATWNTRRRMDSRFGNI